MRLAALLLFAMLPLTGCVSGGEVDFQVKVNFTNPRGGGYGHGVLISPSRVVTVQHVVNNEVMTIQVSRGREKTKAFVHARLPQFSIENLVVLRLVRPMNCARFPVFRPIKAGDSGSVILGTDGDVVGLVTGYIEGGWWPGRTILGTNGSKPKIKETK